MKRATRIRSGYKCSLLAIALTIATSSAGAEVTRSGLMVAYIYNFAKLTEWPAAMAAEASSIFSLCLLNEGQVDETAEKLEGKTVAGKPIVVRKLSTTAENIEQCNILYVGERTPYRVEEIMREVDKAPVLLMSSIGGFADKGGCVEFVENSGRLGFIVNRNCLLRANLSMNARIMQIARSVIE